MDFEDGRWMVMETPFLPMTELLHAVEKTAIAVYDRIGRGDATAADKAAVESLRLGLAEVPVRGRIVIGEGERDSAPMLYMGERVGCGSAQDPAIDIAVDPLEGTSLTAKGMDNALVTMAVAPRGGLLHAPDVYMDKLVLGPAYEGYEGKLLDIDAEPETLFRNCAAHKGVDVADFGLCVLERPRHARIIEAARKLGCRVKLISDGDVVGALLAAMPESGVDMYIGRGGAPEGVLAAAALRCMGAFMRARLHFRNPVEKNRAKIAGITRLDRVYSEQELAPSRPVFFMTGVTSGMLLDGVRRHQGGFTTSSLIFDARYPLQRKIMTQHPGP